MAKLKEKAKEYTPPQTRNIADLDVVDINSEVIEKEYTDNEGKPFTVSVITLNHEDYRVPVTVLKQLKSIMEEKADLKFVKVKKTGEGLKTEYTTIPVE